MSIVKPITPQEVKKGKYTNSEMVLVVNDLIVQKFDGQKATVRQDEIVEAYLLRCPDQTRANVFDYHMLDFEWLYEGVGWNVTYDKPAYNETYPATFTFERAAKH